MSAWVPPATGESALCRFDPRWKSAAFLFAALGVSLLHAPGPVLTALALALLLVLLARLPARWYGQRVLALVLVLGLFVIWLPFVHPDEADLHIGPIALSTMGLLLAAVILAKGIVIASLVLVLLATAPLENTLKAAHSLRVPGVIVHLGVLTLRYLHLLAEEFRRLRIAMRLRGFRNRARLHTYRTLGHVTGSLLVRSHEQAERVAQAMRCRGFDGRYRCLTDFRTRPRDVLAFSAILLTVAALLCWDYGVLPLIAGY
jgi:cobalt/nickel transport system permease protein